MLSNSTATVAEKEGVVQRLAREVFSQGLTGVIPDLVTRDVVYESPTSSVQGIEQFAYLVSTLRSVWADLDVRISEFSADGDVLMAVMTFSGRHVKDFMGITAGGKPFEVTGNIMVAFNGQLICRLDVTYLLNSWINQVRLLKK